VVWYKFIGWFHKIFIPTPTRVILRIECNQCPLLCAILFNLRKVLLLLLEIPRGTIKSENWNSHRDGGEGFKQTNLLWEEYRYFLEQHIPEKRLFCTKTTYYSTLLFV